MAQIDAELTFRAFDEKDFEPLAGLVGRTWLADFPVAAQRAAGRVELSHYLAQATWSLLAEREGELLGAVLLVERDSEPIPGAWLALEERLAAEAEKDPELAEAIRVEMSGVEEEAELEREYAATGAPGTAATIKLLIVSPDAKGLGIGGRLFSAAVERVRKTGAPGYHLLTDDACDVGFYEHKGLSCAMRRRSRAYWPGADPATDDFHVYVYEQEL
ncbi:GNAT family N-acetyltransferase [Olsenella sp. An293]|uniref:GNAT family N-acetyltransferase n=1 Tax=Olsenella sp. An293 TaxID=1965626 RepID=UPI000B366871|nr:GNAT family N-acetyltransferase [Olsenella sp. An293]OUO33615.1 hypothetical protein B5F85_01820 [Olsenella sp. An293]